MMADRMDSIGARTGPRVLNMARAIRARRKAVGLTQIALSQLAGCGADFVYDVEAGKPTLRLDKLLDLLNVLGLELVLTEGKETLRVSATLEPAAPRKTSKRSAKAKAKAKAAKAR